jgi:hypothetical protein
MALLNIVKEAHALIHQYKAPVMPDSMLPAGLCFIPVSTAWKHSRAEGE